MDWENHGERALFQNAEQRDMNERLRAIEEELAKLHNPEEIEVFSYTLLYVHVSDSAYSFMMFTRSLRICNIKI